MFRIAMFAGAAGILVFTCAAAQETKKDPPKKGLAIIEELVKLKPEEFIKRFDKNNDGLISKDELPMFLGKAFDATDKKGTGKLDRDGVAALQKLLQNFLAKGGGQPKNLPIAAYDFDALDKNADGRLTKDELKGTPFYDRFAEIDTNKDGKIDRREFEAFQQREAAKLKKDEGK
jgi:Ca2+-binding EF-hand superfamily protein